MGPREDNHHPYEDASSVAKPTPVPNHLILFDGTCGLCERAVQNLLVRDHDRILRYAPLQGTLAASLRERFPDQIPVGLETVVYVDSSGPQIQIWTRSRAALRVLETLGGSPVSVLILRMVPEAIADFFYRIIAKHRYNIFGRIDQCAVPSPADRALFLE